MVASMPSDVWEDRMSLLNDLKFQSRQGTSEDIEFNPLHFWLMETEAPEGVIS